MKRGITLIEVTVAVFISTILALGIYTMFNFTFRLMADTKARVGAVALAQEKMENIRNLPYNNIGAQGGIPAGNLLQSEQINKNNINYTVALQIVYIDDPFDGIQGGIPNDLLNTDYKRVKVSVSWPFQLSHKPVILLTDVAPKGIETTASGGTLSITVFNANGQSVPQANIDIINTQIIPNISINTVTNNQGKVILPGAPPSVNSYQITVTKNGYSSDQTYSVSLENPNPLKPHASVLENQTTEISFAIDLVSILTIQTKNQSIPSPWVINTDGGAENQIKPALSRDSLNNTYFVWQDYRDGSSPRVYGQKYSSNQIKQWSADKRITDSVKQVDPDITLDDNNNLYIAWGDDKNGNEDIYLQKYNTNGEELWTSNKKVNTDATSADQIMPNIAVDNANNILIAWTDNRNNNQDIYLQKIDGSGNKLWTNDVKVNSDAGTGNQTQPVITIDNSNNIYVAWTDNRNNNQDIYLQKIDGSGNKLWTNDVKVNSDAGTSSQSDPSLALNSELYVSWTDERHDAGDIYMQKLNSSGNKLWTNDIRVNNDGQGNEQLASDLILTTNNLIIIAWQDDRQGDENIYGAVFGGPEPITTMANVPLTITGAKTIGLNPLVYKYQKNKTTDSNGQLILTNMEWDSYTITTGTGYTLKSSDPPLPLNLAPQTNQTLILNISNP